MMETAGGMGEGFTAEVQITRRRKFPSGSDQVPDELIRPVSYGKAFAG